MNAYSRVLEDYRYQRYTKVIRKCDEIIASDSNNQYINKYYLLKAFSIGKSRPGSTSQIRAPLETLYKLSPSSVEGEEAKIYLDKLDNGLNIVEPDTVKVEIPSSPYIYDENIEHYFVLIFPEDAGKIQPTEFRISNFNSEYFKSKKLSSKSIPFGKDQLILVETFEKKNGGDQYMKAFNSTTAKTTLGKTAEDYEHFLISSANFKELIKASKLQEYLDFYKDNYQ